LADIKVNDRLHFSIGPVWGFCQEKWRAPFDLNRQPLPISADSKASGFSNFNDPGIAVGVFVDVNDRVKLGFQYVSEIKAELSGRTELLGIRDNFRSDLTFPQTFTVAASWQVTDKLQLVGDVYYWNYSSTPNDQNLDYKKLPLVKPVAIEAQDAVGAHFGGNYTVSDRLMVRAAVGVMNQSIPTSRVDTLTPDVFGYATALGASYRLSQYWSVNASWTYAWGNSKTYSGDKLSIAINTFGLSGSVKW
jgi:long-subunit fatty acid transport protein